VVSSFLDASKTLKDRGKYIKNEKVMGPQSTSGQKVQEESHYETIFQTLKNSLDVVFLPLKFKDDFCKA
jgi:hypothetical protein